MIHAYDETFVPNAQKVLGTMFDYMVNDMGYDIEDAFEWFIGSGVGISFGKGNSRYILGMSGVELAWHVLENAGVEFEQIKPTYNMRLSREYWTGWICAYYQWYEDTDFEDIQDAVGISKIRRLYNPYHEADIRKAVEKIEEIHGIGDTRGLKNLRVRAGITQKELADLTDIPLRTIQQYEQGQKDIAKAQAEYVIRISHVLNCEPEKIIA